MRFTIASVLLILVVGILIGLALAEWAHRSCSCHRRSPHRRGRRTRCVLHDPSTAFASRERSGHVIGDLGGGWLYLALRSFVTASFANGLI
jgi:hypothetical protein